MNKKQTGELKVLTDQQLSEKELVINPNDGFDLGIMMTEASVKLYLGDNSEQVQAKLILKNECNLGTVEMGTKSIQKLRNSTKVRLFLEEQDDIPKLIVGLL